MKNLKYVLILSLLLVPVCFVKATNDVTVTEDVNIDLTSPAMTLVLETGSTYSSMTVNAGSVAITVSPGGSITLTSNESYSLLNDQSMAVTNVCNTTLSSITLSVGAADGADKTITVSPTTEDCAGSGGTSSGSGSGQGGSGSAGGTTTTPTAGTSAVSKTVSGSDGGSTATTDNKAAVNVPAGLASGNVSMNIVPKVSSTYTSPVAGYSAVASQVYDLNLTAGGTTLSQFTKNVTLTFTYTDTDIAGLDENGLKIYYWDAANSKWVLVGGTVNKATNTITAEVNHFTIFGVFGPKASGEATGDLIKLACPKGATINHACKSVYYLATNSKRYVFPNEKIYSSWYADFSSVKTVASDVMASYSIGGNVTMRPGTYLIKITTDPKVYAVEPGGKLRWVESETVAKKLYGDNWTKKIVDVSDAFFVNYDASQAVENKLVSKHPVGTLIKYADSSDKYYVSSGENNLLLSSDSFSTNGLRNEFVITTDITYPSGANVLGAETALKNTAGP